MIAFNDWFKELYGEIPIGKNSKPPIQFTKLSSEDMATHKDNYACLLFRDMKLPLGEKGKELHKAMQLFYAAFR